METRRIYKYKLEIAKNMQEITMPLGAQIMHIGAQNNTDLSIWCLVNPTQEEMKVRKFMVLATGDEFKIDDGKFYRFIGTVLFDGGSFVVHVFEVT